MRLDRLPLTYAESRARFLRAAEGAGVQPHARAIAATGPDGARLWIDTVVVGTPAPRRALGTPAPRRALCVLSGVHGVEGFAGSALQADLLDRLEPAALPADMAVVLVHAVNPWGMAWWRRQNESNVDLNRNWGRDEGVPAHNDAYDEVHALACPDTPTLPSVDGLVTDALALVAERGEQWVRDAVTAGQYRHPDGLHFGGERTEESNRVLEAVVAQHLAGLEELLVVDLHTGDGPRGALTHLCGTGPGSASDRFLRQVFGDDAVRTGNGPGPGRIAPGVLALAAPARGHCTTLELGTATDEEQLVATYREQWVHRHGDRVRPEHAAAVWAYRECFTPDDPQWERTVLPHGARHLDLAVAAVAAGL